MKKSVFGVFVLSCFLLLSFVSAANMECLVKSSDNVLSTSPREYWTEQTFREEMASNSKQGYIIICHSEGWNWGTNERDPSRFVIVSFDETEYNSTWLESEYNYSAPIYAQDEVTVMGYEVLTERKYKLPLESFLSALEIAWIKNVACSNSTIRQEIKKNLTDVASLIEYNDWGNKPFDWVRPGDPSCNFYASLGQWTVNGSTLVGYPRYNGKREKVLFLENAINLTSAGITLQLAPNTTITSSNLFWDGNLGLPSIGNLSIVIKKKLESVVNVGFTNAYLALDKSSKMVLPDEAGNLIGYVSNGSFVEIETLCPGNNQSSVDDFLSEGGNCKIDQELDLAIWTKHFTQFVTFCPEEWKTPLEIIDSSVRIDRANWLIDDDIDTVGLYQWITGHHWVILDLGESVDVRNIRIWHKKWGGAELDVEEIYVSDNLEYFGETLGALPALGNSEESQWNEGDIQSKEGRYIKLVSEYTPYGAAYWREFDALVSVCE